MAQSNTLELACILSTRNAQERIYILNEIHKVIIEMFTALDTLNNVDEVTLDYIATFEHNKLIYKQVISLPLLTWFTMELTTTSNTSYIAKYIKLTTFEQQLYVKHRKNIFKQRIEDLNLAKVCDFAALIQGINTERKPYPNMAILDTTQNIEETPMQEGNLDIEPELNPKLEPEITTIDSEEDSTIENQTEIQEIINKYESRITLEVDKIVEVYAGLYKAGMELENPLGILTSTGYYTLDKDTKIKLNVDAVLRKVYSQIDLLLGGTALTLAEPHSKISLKNIVEKAWTYYPHYQVYNCYGYIRDKESQNYTQYKTWESFRKGIKQNTLDVMHSVIASCIKSKGVPKTDEDTINLDDYIEDIIEQVRFALTNAIVVYDFDTRSSIKLRFYSQNSKIDRKKLEDAIFRSKGSLFSNKGEISICEPDETGVYTIAIIFDKVAEGQKPLFAYQAVEALKLKGQKPNWSNFILGKDVKSDTMLTVNLADNDHYNCVIGAGPRSGKGVTTLNILAVAISQQFPVLYMDGKPEMTKELWTLADKYGVPFLAVDVNDRYRNMPYTDFPTEITEYSNTLGGVVAYLKGIQLGLLTAMLRYENNEDNKKLDIKVKSFDIKSKTRMVIVCDEIVKFKMAYDSTYMPLKAFASKNKKNEEIFKYISKVLEWMDGLDNQIIGNMASEIPMARQNWFWLTQDLIKSTWTVSSGDGDKNVVRNAIRKAKTMKLCGNIMTTGNNTLALPQKQGQATVDAENYINGYQRCFGYHLSQEPNSYDDIKIIKPYLVLPSVEPNSEAIRGLTSMPKEALTKAYNQDGTFKAEVGFEGLITMLADRNKDAIADGLSLCYHIMHEILRRAGLIQKYMHLPYEEQVYGYMYDLSADTFISTSNLAQRVRDNYGANKYNDFTDVDLMETQANDIDLMSSSRKTQAKTNLKVNAPTFDNVDLTIPPKAPLNASKQLEFDLTDMNLQMPTQQPKQVDKLAIGQARVQQQVSNPRLIQPNISYNANNKVVLKDRRLAQPLTDAIDCTYAARVELSKVKTMLLNTPIGTDIYAKQLWANILKETTVKNNKGITKALVKRINIYGDNLYLNDRLIDLNGVLGGYDGIRLTDIVDFKHMFKYFKNVQDVGLDEEMLSRFFMQYNITDLLDIFKVLPHLQVLYIFKSNTVDTFTRTQFNKQKAQEVASKANITRLIEEHRYVKTQGKLQMGKDKSLRSEWNTCTTRKKVWGSTIGKHCLNSAFNTKKKGLAKRCTYFSLGVFVSITGGLAWFGFNFTRALHRRYRK